MDRALNPKDEKQTIYEIYRACRLCGAGAGYKMPIIQNVVDLDGDGIELRQKIKECVQIEVSHTDRMPPLICELCVDKVNEFHEFLNMCKQSNRRTRLRLGLPLQTPTRDSVDSENCILGVTEPVLNDSDAEPHAKNKNKKIKVKKEPVEVKIKIESARPSPKPEPKPKPELKPRAREAWESSEEARWTVISRGRRSARSPSPSPKRTTRQSVELYNTPQTEETLVVDKSKQKRTREKDVKIDTPPPPKKVKTNPEPVKNLKVGPRSSKNTQQIPKELPVPKLILKPQPTRTVSKNDRKPSPAPQPPPSKTTSKATPSKALPSKGSPSKATPSKALPSKAASSPAVPKAFFCQICNIQTKNAYGLTVHNASKHIPNFTSPKYACNACELWFQTVEEANTHHRNHRTQNNPYKCTRCYGYFKLQQAYEDHFGNALCLSVYEVPDVKCWDCWRTFPTNKLLEEHRCLGEDGRPGGKCNKCNRNYTLLKNLVKHESTCTYKKKGEVIVDPDVQARILPMQVRVARCDSLLKTRGHVDSSKVPQTYGLDSKCVYPYLKHIKVKSEPNTKSIPHMVSINEDVKEEFRESYVHWDSDSDVSDSASVDTDSSQKTVNTLSTISLKTIFSKKCMGKVPRKLKVKSETFDSFNDFGMCKKIDKIIDTLSNDDTQTSCSHDSDSILERNLAKTKDITEGDGSKKDGNSPSTVSKDDSLTSCDSDSILDKGMRVASNKAENDKVNEVVMNVPDKQNDTSEKEVTSVKLNDTSKTPETNHILGDSENVQSNTGYENDNDKKEKDDPKPLKDNDLSKDEEMPEQGPSDDVKMSCNTESLNNDSSCNIDDRISQSCENQQEEANESNLNNLEDSQNTNVTNRVTNETDSKNDSVDSNNQFSRNIDSLNEDKLINNHSGNGFEKMDVDEQKELVTENDISKDATVHENHAQNSEKPTENNEIFSKIDEITNKILEENQTCQLDGDKHSTCNTKDDNQKSDPYSDSISLNSIGNEIATENQDKFNVNDLNEDDRKLMAELDAQIGENEQKISENDTKISENNQDLGDNIQKSQENHQKFSESDQRTKDHFIDNLLKKQDSDLRSLELDSISDDEFNFDI